METVACPSGTTLAPLASGNAHIAGDASNIPVQEGGARPGDVGRLSSGARRAGKEGKKPDLVRDRVIKTVLSLDLDPVTEIPGEGPSESQEDWDVGGRPFGSENVRGPRKSSGSRRSSRGRTGSGSTIMQSSEVEEEGGEATVAAASGGEHGVPVEEGEAEEGDDCCVEVAGGLEIEVRVSAPVICVLLVHDEEAGSDCDRGGVRSRSSFARVISRGGAGFPPGETAGNGVIGSSIQQVETGEDQLKVDTAGKEGSGEGRENGLVDGALVLLEISGLRVEYRDTLGGGQAGRGTGAGEVGIGQVGGLTGGVENGSSLSREGVGGPAAVRLDHDFCLTAASFTVKDVYQRVGNEYSYMLSSRDPLSSMSMVEKLGGGSASGWVPEASQGVSSPSRTGDVAIRITRALSRGGEKEGGAAVAVATRSTVVALGGVWANWNPETVAALSIFAYGMYGHRENGDNNGAGDKIDPGARVRSPSEASGHLARDVPGDGDSGGSAVGGGASMQGAARVEGGESTGTPGGVVVVEIKRVSLWLNKEVHGRRLLFFEAGDSTVSTVEDSSVMK